MSGQPRPSAGIIAAAIVAIAGSGLTLLVGLIEIGVSFIRLPATDSQLPAPFLKYSLFLAAAMAFGFGAWGIASAVGLLRLREWARISTLVYSAILLVFTIFPMVLFLAMPFPPFQSTQSPSEGNTSPQEITHMVRVVTAVIYSIPAAVAIWWLIFFNRAAVKAQFASARYSLPASSLPTPTSLPVTPVASAQTRPVRPLSISIIGWYLIVTGGLMLPFGLLIHMPVGFLGWILTGPRASLLFLIYGVIQLGLGYGLLKLKPLSRTLTIWYFLWTILSCLAQTLLPGREARLQAVMDSMAPILRASPSQVAWSMHSARFSVWAGGVFGVLIAAVIIWFLVREKSAFETVRV